MNCRWKEITQRVISMTRFCHDFDWAKVTGTVYIYTPWPTDNSTVRLTLTFFVCCSVMVVWIVICKYNLIYFCFKNNLVIYFIFIINLGLRGGLKKFCVYLGCVENYQFFSGSEDISCKLISMFILLIVQNESNVCIFLKVRKNIMIIFSENVSFTIIKIQWWNLMFVVPNYF